MAASLLVIFPGSDMDVYSDGGCSGVFVSVMGRDCGPVRHLKLDSVSGEPMLAFTSVQVFRHARDHSKARQLCDE